MIACDDDVDIRSGYGMVKIDTEFIMFIFEHVCKEQQPVIFLRI